MIKTPRVQSMSTISYPDLYKRQGHNKIYSLYYCDTKNCWTKVEFGTKSFGWLVCHVVGLFTSRGVNKPTLRQTNHTNDFVHSKSHAREKPLLTG